MQVANQQLDRPTASSFVHPLLLVFSVICAVVSVTFFLCLLIQVRLFDFHIALSNLLRLSLGVSRYYAI